MSLKTECLLISAKEFLIPSWIDSNVHYHFLKHFILGVVISLINWRSLPPPLLCPPPKGRNWSFGLEKFILDFAFLLRHLIYSSVSSVSLNWKLGLNSDTNIFGKILHMLWHIRRHILSSWLTLKYAKIVQGVK